MSASESRSRPLRLAARLRRDVEAVALEDRFETGRIAVALTGSLAEFPDARTTFLALVNQVVRFCPNLLLATADAELLAAARSIAIDVHGAKPELPAVDRVEAREADVVIEVGNDPGGDPSWITVNSTRWVARVASGGDQGHLPRSSDSSNALGALAAASLGAGEAFLMLAGVPRVPRAWECSLIEGGSGRPGAFDVGPELPTIPVELDGLLVGCGGVSNGWADAMRQLPVCGGLITVDRQALRIENMGPYVLARLADLGRSKAELLAEALATRFDVISHSEEFELFKLRLSFGLNLPPLVVAGLDNVETRHSIQRLWPSVLVDMAAGGTTSQALVHLGDGGGQCLLGALTLPPDADTYAQRVAKLTGLRPERVLEGATTPVTAEDVAAAPPEMRDELEDAYRRAQLLCGRITERNLFGEEATDDFAPAAPFVSALAGTIGAAETMKSLLGLGSRSGFHNQYDFLGGRGRSLLMRCSPSCKCHRLRRVDA